MFLIYLVSNFGSGRWFNTPYYMIKYMIDSTKKQIGMVALLHSLSNVKLTHEI